MSSENERSEGAGRRADPRVLRAVAHPIRLDLLDLLRLHGPMTASRCAEQLKLTPKVCSYHLGQLAKYGLIEETGGGKGRARPWRLVPTSFDYVHQPGEEQRTARAASEFAGVMVDRDVRAVRAFLAERDRLEKRWRNKSTLSSNSLWLSPKQLGALGNELMGVLAKYSDGDNEPDGRPVRVALYAVPVLVPASDGREPATGDTQPASDAANGEA